jgi:hypothetical protein
VSIVRLIPDRVEWALRKFPRIVRTCGVSGVNIKFILLSEMPTLYCIPGLIAWDSSLTGCQGMILKRRPCRMQYTSSLR